MTILTLVHVLLSLIGIGSGLFVVVGIRRTSPLDPWTRLFLASTLLTSVTGFFFPFHGFTPALGVGILSLILLGVAIYALWSRRLAGSWMTAYVITAVTALYLNIFVLVVQLFRKVPALHALAPTESELPFALTQLAVLATFVGIGVQANRRLHALPLPAARKAVGGFR